MKKKLATILVLSLFISSVGLSAHADSNRQRGMINVNSTANTEVAPDVAEICFTVKTYDTKSMEKATLENKTVSDKVFAVLKTFINTEKGDYVKTSDFSANPLYTYNNSKKSLDKYEVSNRILVHTESIEKIGKMIDNAITAGATNVDSLVFSVSNYETQCNELLTIAAQKSKKRAEILAKALGTDIDGVSHLSTSCSANNNNQPRLYMAKNMISDVAAETMGGANSTIISNGVIKINANVNAGFYVK